MWYVVQVSTGAEERIRLQCEKKIDKSIMEECFIPQYEEKKHFRGKWTVQKKILFPGYVFVVTDYLNDLYEELKHIDGMTKMIGTGQEIVPLTDEEVEFIQHFGGEDKIVQMSEGIIENSQLKILSGPLEGMEAFIRKIDRHKRKAWLEIEMFGRMQRVEVGLEIISKTV